VECESGVRRSWERNKSANRLYIPKRPLPAYTEETLARPADIAVELLTQHIPTLVKKAAPHFKRDDYGVLNLAPEFDGEIRYFVERVILTDPSYLRAAKEAMEIDPDARSRLFESSALMERLVRNTLIGACEDQASAAESAALNQIPPFFFGGGR
jgi:hypothetical protein